MSGPVRGMGTGAAGGGPVRVVLVDDHSLFRDGLRRLLASDGRFEVVGEAASGEEFLALMKDGGEADGWGEEGGGERLVFMDIDMPGTVSGIEATRRAMERWPELRIVALTMHGDDEYRTAMMDAGAVGFLAKDSRFEEVVSAALEAIGRNEGGAAEEGDVEGAKGAEWGGEAEPDHELESEAGFGPGPEPLSDREREVLPLICEGLSTGRIAERLFISPRTVDKHRANILAKTGCRNTASLVVWALRNRMIKI